MGIDHPRGGGRVNCDGRNGNRLAHMFPLCSDIPMMRIDETAIARAILSAPGWARVGITAPVERLREEAARELARAVLEGATDDPAPVNQLTLML